MTLLISTVGKSRGWISQDSLWYHEPSRWMPWRRGGRVSMRRKVAIVEKARMIVGTSCLVLWTNPMKAAARRYTDFDAFVRDLPRPWLVRRPGMPCQIVVVGWSGSRGRVMGFELYAAPDADPTFEHVDIGTKTDDDLATGGLHYREIRKLAQFAKPDPADDEIEHLHTLIAANILHASAGGHYGTPFAGGVVDFASVTRDGIELRQLSVALADAA